MLIDLNRHRPSRLRERDIIERFAARLDAYAAEH